MDALKIGLSAALTLVPALAGCSTTPPSNAADRAIAMYRESLEPSGTLSLQRDSAERQNEQSTTNAPSALTIETAIDMAKKNSTRLLALQAAAVAAEANVAAADRRRNPELRVSQLRLDELANHNPQLRTAVRFFPDRPGAIAADVAEARAKHAQILANLHMEEQALEADVRWAFDDVVLLEAEIDAGREVSKIRQSVATQMHNRVAAAESTSLDETLAELSAVEAEADLAAQEARRREALGMLCDLVGINSEATVEIRGDPPLAWPPAALPSEKTLVEQALRRNPAVAMAAARIDAADARAFAERAKRFPWFSFLELGYEFSPKTNPGLGWTFQGGIDVPIFDTNRHGVAASDAAKTAALRAFEAEVERVAREVRARLREVHVAEALVTQYRARAVPTAEKAESEAKRALAANRIDALRALSVDDRRAIVQLRLLRLIRSYRSALSELRRASGNVNSAVTP